MIINRLETLFGEPHTLENGINIYSPLLRDIVRAKELNYMIHLSFCSFNKKKILVDMFNLSPEEFEQFGNEDDYTSLIKIVSVVPYIEEALSFFVREQVDFKEETFFVNGREFVNKDNYKFVSKIIYELNGVFVEEQKEMKFKNNRTKEAYEEFIKLQKKHKKKEDGLELKEIVSILICSEGNGITHFNMGDLTIYQAYEQFERLSMKENYRTIVPLWANGHLKEGERPPEWKTKIKF
ncbi:hypothetical protein MHB54_27930 [Paenibacillus sp. FSL M7-0802]|uniref:hypothetical protein n=1 Tax=Paenibacillus sp. FSL M7-0802 TaxID=2921536 RepID=UPI0030F7BC15